MSRNLKESESIGWTVSLNFQNENEFYELNGSDYVLDLITEIENSLLILTINSDNANYLTNKKGLTKEDFENYAKVDLKNIKGAGYNLIATPKKINKDTFDRIVSKKALLLFGEEAKNALFRNICIKK